MVAVLVLHGSMHKSTSTNRIFAETGSDSKMGAIFLNADLVLEAKFDLRPLASALTSNGLILLGEVAAKGEVWKATFESNLVKPTPERALAKILAALESLDDGHRAAWERCLSRCLDLGYQCGDGSFESTGLISNSTLSRIATSGASMAVTIYRR